MNLLQADFCSYHYAQDELLKVINDYKFAKFDVSLQVSLG